MTLVMVSGGFDPLHDGHMDYLEGAARHGRVLVALNSDDWLIRKKGYCFQPWSVRARILNAIFWVHEVMSLDDSDGTVCDALRGVCPRIFCNGGDRHVTDPLEYDCCKKFGIEQLFGIGGAKTNSSSKLVHAVLDKARSSYA